MAARVVDSSPEYTRSACEKSLQRLDLPFVDLYYIHRLDGKTPIEKTMEVLKELKKEGKIKYIGVSECSADSLRRACKVEHVDAVQIEYSPFALEIEDEQIGVLKACRELGCAVVAYSPIGRAACLVGRFEVIKTLEKAMSELRGLVSVKRTSTRISSLWTQSPRLQRRRALHQVN